jgi:hypothetical protein
MGVLIGHLVPHAYLTTNYIDGVDFGVKVVHHSPVLIVEITEVAIVLTESFVEVGEVIVRQYHLIFAS